MSISSDLRCFPDALAKSKLLKEETSGVGWLYGVSADGYSKVIAYLNRAHFPELDLKPNVSPTKIAQKIQRIEGAWTSGSPMEWLSKYGIREPTGFEDSLGTIGGGNHFAEVQEVEEVLEGETFERLGLKRDRLALLGEPISLTLYAKTRAIF